MTILLDNLYFDAWRPTEFNGLWADSFILKISAQSALPPAEYANGVYQVASRLVRKRPGASLWVQLDAPGSWYLNTLRSVLAWKGKLPVVVTPCLKNSVPQLKEYRVRPTLGRERPPEPETVQAATLLISPAALACLRVLGRIERGRFGEIASLAGLDNQRAVYALDELLAAGYADEETSGGNGVFWSLKRKGLEAALRSWGIPKEISFARRKELSLSDPEGYHRNVSRLWPHWLRSAWPHVQVWAGWSEVRMPGLSVTPDALAWGMLGPFETLFWLEVEDGHCTRLEIQKKIRRRFSQAREYAKQENVHLVFALLGREWVRNAARQVFTDMTKDVAVVLGDWKDVGRLPLTEWGRVEWN